MRSIYLKTGPLAAAFPHQTRRGRVSFAGELILCWRIDSNGSRKSSRGRNGKDGGGHGRILAVTHGNGSSKLSISSLEISRVAWIGILTVE
eukprot:CAMPEP_0194086582 /NCGR_PEP_ID=MMETSP0149-20130528/21645_1 /TAXON_ID=122233 /ORGANISM="Chaetoceros debilis, Strain MM31A-1" /LENGTH=90 /DNA_ID=CAMNT_0038769697 /DNA_START=132 /DNA_END=401 /DNA_ORIENTATION=+